MKQKIGGQVALHIIFLIMVLMYIVPFLMVISVSFTDEMSLIVDLSLIHISETTRL